MQFSGKLTDAELKDVRKLVRPKRYWLLLIGSNWYGIALTVAVVWATISGLVGHTKPNWGAVALIWAAIGGIVLYAVYKTKRDNKRELDQMNAALPDWISLATDGTKLDGPRGATSFVPWANFSGWREGQQVMLIDQSDGRQFVMLPLAQLSEVERLPIRQMLQSHIASISGKS